MKVRVYFDYENGWDEAPDWATDDGDAHTIEVSRIRWWLFVHGTRLARWIEWRASRLIAWPRFPFK